MRVSQLPSIQVAPQAAASAVLAAPPAAATPAVNSDFRETVATSAEDWGHMGKKLGTLGAVTLASTYLPMAVANYTYNLPAAVFLPLCIGSSIAAMALTSWEEKHVGVGKRIGQAVGATAGALVGAGTATAHSILGKKVEPAIIELKTREPQGRLAREPLLQRGLHSVQRNMFKTEPVRNRNIEIGEMVGSTISTMALAYTIPHVVGNAMGGVVGTVCQTLLGPLSGLVAGGFVENIFGVGRTVGELAGMGVTKFQDKFGSHKEPAPATVYPELFQCAMPDPSSGPLKKGFLLMNHLIGQPIMGFLVDTTQMANRVFSEEPYQSLKFQDRPSPQVNKDRLIESFKTLACVHGPSGHEELVGEAICKRLDELGIPWVRQPDGSVIGTLAATPGQEDAPTVALSAHQDTVEATKPENLRVGPRRIHTNEKGVLGADDRAGIAEILEAVQTVKEQNLAHPELKLVFTVDEERGLIGAGRLKPEDISTRPTLGFVVDALDPKDVYLTNDGVVLNLDSVKYNHSQEDPLIQVVFRSMANAGLKPRAMHVPILTGAGSDANTLAFNSKNIHSLAVGAGEQDMHTPLEHVRIKDLEQAARHVVGFITNSCDLKVAGEKIVPRYSLN